MLVYHIRGTRNISDYNSKLPSDLNPIRLINSEEWRTGLKEFTSPDFPPQDCVFLKFAGGKVDFFKQPVIDHPEPALASAATAGSVGKSWKRSKLLRPSMPQ